MCIMENMYSQTIAKRKYKNKRIKIINEKKKIQFLDKEKLQMKNELF